MIRRTIQIVLILVCVSGCHRPAKSVAEHPSEPWAAEVAAFTAGLHRYIEVTGSTPMSKEILQRFCTASNLPCTSVDWNRFRWEQADHIRVTVLYDLDGDTMIPISVAIPRQP